MYKGNNIGTIGENLTHQYLLKEGYRILTRNYRRQWGEIDIVAQTLDRTLVFVEVKTMKASPSLKPEDNLTKAKLVKLRRTCQAFCGANPDLVDERKGWRIDLIAITLPAEHGNDDLTYLYKNCIIKQYENI